MDKSPLLYYLAISLIKEITPSVKKKFLNHIGGCEQFFTISEKSFEQAIRIHSINLFKSREQILKEAIKVFELCSKKQVKVISLIDKEYPLRLKQIYDPPLVIYAKGDLSKWEQLGKSKKSHLSIVGTRNPSLYSQNFAKKAAELMSNYKVAIISGLAKGIDTQAHLGSFKSGRTLAVLGSGLDCIYPRSNLRLAYQIVENGGLLVSEYPIGVPPLRHHFPERNRIISALSDALLMVEAPIKSGALITLRWGLEQSKEIMIMCPPDQNERYQGNHHYLEQGATPTHGFSELYHYFQLSKELLTTNSNSNELDNPVLNYLKSGPKSLTEIATFFKQSSHDILSKLMPHILAQKVIETPGNKYYLAWK